MSDLSAPSAALGADQKTAGEASALPIWGRYAVAAVLVAAATLAAFIVEQLIDAPNLTLIFVLPVVIAGASFGWGPSLFAALTGVLAFDFFFTEPRYTFRIDQPSDIWAAALLLIITAAIVSGVSANARQRKLEAQRAAAQAQALQVLAHDAIEGRPHAAIVQGAAEALHRIFDAPAVVFESRGSEIAFSATAGNASPTPADIEAAQGALANRKPTRASSYPYEQSGFDFWPIVTPAGCKAALGVRFDGERPTEPERLVEVVGGYLAAAFR